MRTFELKFFGPMALLLAVSLGMPACGAKDGDGETAAGEEGGGAGDGGDAGAADGGGDAGGAADGGADAGDDPDATGDEFQDAVVDVTSLLIDEGEGQGLTADGLRASMSEARELVNNVVAEAFGQLKMWAATEPAKKGANFRRWDGTKDGVEYRFLLARRPAKPGLWGYLVVARADGGGADEWKPILAGAFAKKAARRGAGRMTFLPQNLKLLKPELEWDGAAHFRFLNLANKKVVAFGAKGLVTPRHESPINGVVQYWKGSLGKRAFRYVHEANVVGGDAKEWLGVRALYKLGTGGFMHALLHGGDVPADHDPITARGCWKEGEWVFLTSNPPDLFDNATGEVGDCLEEFKAAGGDPPDPTAEAADAMGDWDQDEDFGIPELPSEEDADTDVEEPADE